MRGQITVDALAAGLISAIILLLVTDVSRVITAHGVTSLRAYELSISVDRFAESLTSPSWVGANLTWFDIVWLWSEPLVWSWGGAPLRSGVRSYMAVDAYKWTLYSKGGTVDSPIVLDNGKMQADLVFPNDDLHMSGEAVVKSYDVILVKRGSTWVNDPNLPQVSTSGGGITISYSGTVPHVKMVWVTISGDPLYGWVRWLHRRYDELLSSGMSEREAYRELAREAVSTSGKVVFYSSTGWSTSDPVELVRRIIAEGESSGLSLTIVAIGGGPFTVDLKGQLPEIMSPLSWAAGMFPVKLRVGVAVR